MMKTLLFLAGLFFVLSSFALGLEKSEIKNFHGSYVLDRGSAKADVWHLAGADRQENVTFEVYKENQQIRLITPTEEHLFEDLPDFILDLDRLSWSGLNALTLGQEVGLGLTTLEGSGSSMDLNLKNLQGNCRGTTLNGDYLENLIASCTEYGDLSFQSLKTNEALRRNQTSLFQFLQAILSQKNNAQGSVELEDFNLRVRNKKYDLRVKANLSLSATIKAEGSFDYQQDRVRIKIDKVKASFLTITNKVFDELEKIQSPNIVVNRPFVTILF